MLEQNKMTKMIYGLLHFEKQTFKMYTNDFHQDVIEWHGNKIVVGDNFLSLNGSLQDNVEEVMTFVKAACEE
jgi:hypothetical protein